MAQYLRALTALVEDRGFFVPGTHMSAHNHLELHPVPRSILPSSGFLGHCMNMVQSYMWGKQNTHTHNE